MNFIQWIIYLIQFINEIHPCKMTFMHMKSFIYEHIHPCKWIKITLNFKFQAKSSRSCTSQPLLWNTYWFIKFDLLKPWRECTTLVHVKKLFVNPNKQIQSIPLPNKKPKFQNNIQSLTKAMRHQDFKYIWVTWLHQGSIFLDAINHLFKKEINNLKIWKQQIYVWG